MKAVATTLRRKAANKRKDIFLIEKKSSPGLTSKLWERNFFNEKLSARKKHTLKKRTLSPVHLGGELLYAVKSYSM